jgi:hypothetical protein
MLDIIIITAGLTAAACGLLLLAFALGIRHERRRQQAIAEWVCAQQAEAVESMLHGVGADAPHLPTRDEVEREYLRQTDTANLRPL